MGDWTPGNRVDSRLGARQRPVELDETGPGSMAKGSPPGALPSPGGAWLGKSPRDSGGRHSSWLSWYRAPLVAGIPSVASVLDSESALVPLLPPSTPVILYSTR